ncbi:MAG TPA: BON domain-containing protein [Bryobacteraceae bacterium]|nr:BON domain-containing protein [Bryobacteraceae bacterium]
MRLNILNKFMIAAAALGVTIGFAATSDNVSAPDAVIAQKLTHEIRMYPRYSIFDNISFFVDEGRVELIGEVSEPYKKADLGRIAQRIPGVTSLSNELRVLPVSPMDNRLRLQVARAIYRDPVLSRYGIQALPPIHIIVDNGHVTLEGAVSTEMEKNVAGLRAAAAGLSFGPVQNNLTVEHPKRKS